MVNQLFTFGPVRQLHYTLHVFSYVEYTVVVSVMQIYRRWLLSSNRVRYLEHGVN